MNNHKIMKIEWYPWLTKPYLKIIHQYNQKKLHHAIMIQSPSGMGINSLVWEFSCWMLCVYPKKFISCKKCHSCLLMKSHNHPDWYSINTINNTKKIDLNYIRSIVKNLMLTSNQNGTKIVWITHPKTLTYFSNNCFLKIVEDPPKKTFFIIRIHKLYDIDPVLSSRFILWNIQKPCRKKSFTWLKNQTGCSDIECNTALNICNNTPISSKKLLNTSIWMLRLKFFKQLQIAIKNNNLFALLSIFNEKNFEQLIDWIYLLFIDVIKYKYKIYQYLTNIDQIKLIKQLSNNLSYQSLEYSIKSWIQCKNKLLHISEVNVQLILLEQLLRWEKILL